jgi:hypothetical protein
MGMRPSALASLASNRSHARSAQGVTKKGGAVMHEISVWLIATDEFAFETILEREFAHENPYSEHCP